MKWARDNRFADYAIIGLNEVRTKQLGLSLDSLLRRMKNVVVLLRLPREGGGDASRSKRVMLPYDKEGNSLDSPMEKSRRHSGKKR
jgi:hypothetical protein